MDTECGNDLLPESYVDRASSEIIPNNPGMVSNRPQNSFEIISEDLRKSFVGQQVEV